MISVQIQVKRAINGKAICKGWATMTVVIPYVRIIVA